MARRVAKRSPRGKPAVRTKTPTDHITRAEFDALNRQIRVLQVQLRRLSEMQAQFDTLKRIVQRLAEQISAIAASLAGVTPGIR
jgi:hypothetical protein